MKNKKRNTKKTVRNYCSWNISVRDYARVIKAAKKKGMNGVEYAAWLISKYVK